VALSCIAWAYGVIGARERVHARLPGWSCGSRPALAGPAQRRIAVDPARAAPPALALLIAGVAFPLSRIGRIDLVAHAVDVLLLGASAWLATRLPAGTSSVRSPNAC
jgi:hypothetical protein